MFRLFCLKIYLFLVYIGNTFKIIPSHVFCETENLLQFHGSSISIVNLVMISRFTYVSKINRLPYLLKYMHEVWPYY